MRAELLFEAEPFEFDMEFGERSQLSRGFNGAGSDYESDDEWEGEVSRSSPAYIRWVQQSLNKIVGLRLAEDGVAGTQTRSAVRSFQQQRRLTVDGDVGPQTEAALIAAGAATPPGASAPGGSQSPSSQEGVRWVQMALNQILGLRLAVDGVVGTQTRSAIRSFQQKQGLAVTGLDDPQTSLRMATALRGPAAGPPCARVRPREILAGFDFDSDKVLPAHQRKLVELAFCIIDSQKAGLPVRLVRVLGHTDTEGSPTYNEGLGRRRADQVSRHLKETLNRILPGSANKVQIVPVTRGEREPVSTVATTNRRAEVCLPQLSACTCEGFFAEYDLRFEPSSSTRGVPGNPCLTDDERTQRIADVEAMVVDPSRPDGRGPLVLRRDARAAAARAGVTSPPAAAPTALSPVVRRLSAAQLDLYRECFGDGLGGINFKPFQTCFERFANGELRQPSAGSGVGEPNGGFFFLFAEFAFLCIDTGIDVTLWTQALKPFVMTQEIFMHLYRSPPRPPAPPAVGAALPSTGPALRTLDGDFSDTNFSAAGQSDAARKAALRAKYAPMNLAALRDAARDNLLRAQRMP